MRPDLTSHADAFQSDLMHFARLLIQTPSLPGQEQYIATIVQHEMEQLGYDQVWRDEVGNLIGLLKGTGGGKALMLNTHMDHVDVGDPSQWPYPPYSATLSDGYIWGRGACDVKGALAVQVYAPAIARKAGLALRGDVYVTAVVLEERGGWGAAHVVKKIKTDYAILGEATNNELRIGHRGRMELMVRFTGRSVHASAPTRGANPHYAIARFLTKLPEMRMVSDSTFGHSTVAPTLVQSDQTSGNVTPGELRLMLDWRNIPNETTEQILAKVQKLLAANPEPGVGAQVMMNQSRLQTYTGLSELRDVTHPGYALSANHPFVTTARATLQKALEREVELGSWMFATDGGHLMAAGIPTIGFGPGDENEAHTIHDRVAVAQLREATVGYLALLETLCQ
jgi:putative selenium metabolism hydrolase